MFEILVVDDDAELGEVVCLLLEQAGHRAQVARSNDEALANVRRARPDLVLADWNMPGGGADDLRDRLAAAGYAGVPLVLMSGMSIGIAEGFAAVLPKPFPAQRLLDLVERLMQPSRTVGSPP